MTITVKMDLETLNYRSTQLRSVLAKNLRQINSLLQFKENVRKFGFFDCPYKLCVILANYQLSVAYIY